MIRKTTSIAVLGMLILLAGAVCLGVSVNQVSAESAVVIIVNPSIGESSISADDLKSIYLGEKVVWGDNSEIKLAMLKEGDVHDSFLKMAVAKTAAQFNAYWKKLVFTGKGIEPKEFESEKDMIDFVANTKGAIGYLASGSDKGSAKEIAVN